MICSGGYEILRLLCYLLKNIETMLLLYPIVSSRLMIIIWKHRNINENPKLICLSEQYGYAIRSNYSITKAGLQFNSIIVFPFSQSFRLIQLCFLKIDWNSLTIEGRDNSHTLFGMNPDGQIIRFDLPMQQLFPIQIEFFLTIANTSAPLSISVGWFFPLSSVPYA